MINPIKYFILATISVALLGCTKISNFMLGEDNVTPAKPLQTVTANLKVTPVWKTRVGQGNRGQQYIFTPAMTDELIITTDIRGKVSATQVADGEIRWQTPLREAISMGPSIGENTVIIGTQQAEIVALDLTTGHERWRKSISSEVLAKPLITADAVYTKTIDGNFYALNILNGEEIWRYTHGAPTLTLQTDSAPVATKEAILVGFSDGKLVGLKPLSGEVLWVRALAVAEGSSDVTRMRDFASTPIIDNDTVYIVGYQGAIQALSLITGRVRWNRPLSSFHALAFANGQLFVSDEQDYVWAIDAKDGHVLWRQDQLTGRHISSPTVMNDTLVIADEAGYLHWLSQEDGHVLARSRASRLGASAQPLVHKNDVYIFTNNGYLRDFRVEAQELQA